MGNAIFCGKAILGCLRRLITRKYKKALLLCMCGIWNDVGNGEALNNTNFY
jgi:hypothetical protein